MLQSQEQVKVKKLLIEAITTLCKNGLSYQTEFCIEGLLGITLDNKDILLVNIKENVKSGDMKFDITPEACSSLNSDLSTSEAPYNTLVPVPIGIIPKRRKKRKSSNVSKRKIETVESPINEYKDYDCLTQDQESAFRACAGDVDATKHLTNHFDDIPQLGDSEYISLTYEDCDKDHISDTSAHSNALHKDEGYNQTSSLQQSPRISLGGDEIPLDLGLHADLPGNLSVVWDEPNMEMPVNLSEQLKQEVNTPRFC